MAYIAFMAILLGASGVVGGVEAGSTARAIAAAVVHIAGIFALAAAKKDEPDDAHEEDSTDMLGSSVDKHFGGR